MACIVDLFNDVLQGATPGGTFEYLYYDSDCDSNEDAGGSVPFIDNNNSVNVDGFIPGCYWFRYTVGEGDCQQTLDFPILIQNAADPGIGNTVFPCTGDAEINLFSLIGGTPDLNGVWSGQGTLSPAYNEGDPDTPIDDTFDPQTSGEGTFVFIYTVSQQIPPGYDISNCPNCQSQSITVVIHVNECGTPPNCDEGEGGQYSICSSGGCTFNLFDLLLGTPATGGIWTLLPGAPQVIVISGGYLGTVNFANSQVGFYQFEYSLSNIDPLCTDTALITIQVVQQPNAGNNTALTMCETFGNSNLNGFLGPHTPGGTWTLSPALPAGTFTSNGFINPEVGDAGSYVATYTVSAAVNGPCGTSCSDTATINITIIPNCNAGINGSDVICDDESFVLDPVAMFGAGTTTGGTFTIVGQSVNCNGVYDDAIFSVNGGPVQNYQGDQIPAGATIDDFQTLGCILMFYNCFSSPPLCNDQSQFILNVQECVPACAANVVIQAVACALSIQSISGCPTPVYQWQIWNGTTWLPAPGDNDNSTYNGANGSTYRLRLTNCPNCPNPIYSNQITVNCPPNPACSITCVLTYNAAQTRLEAVITNSGGAGASVGYQFNRYNNNTPLCGSCTGVQVATCSGNVIVPPAGSVQVNCTVQQSCVEQCFRFVTIAGGCNQTICCTKIPAIGVGLKCYILPTDPQYTEILSLNVTPCGGGLTNIINAAQFGCDEYVNVPPVGVCDGNLNCSYAQIVIDINQYLAANGYAGTAYVVQTNKSSNIRIKDTNIVFNNVLTNHGTVNFIQENTCAAGDTTTFHFQGVDSQENFPVLIGTLYAGAPGSINLFDMLDLYAEDVSHGGTFAIATNGFPLPGNCASIVQNCYSGGSPPVTVVNNIGNPDHGDVNWTAFVASSNNCFWQASYTVGLGNGYNECFYFQIRFDNTP